MLYLDVMLGVEDCLKHCKAMVGKQNVPVGIAIAAQSTRTKTCEDKTLAGYQRGHQVPSEVLSPILHRRKVAGNQRRTKRTRMKSLQYDAIIH